MADGDTGAVTRHLLIGGPGRSGTSFLVRYLAEVGLETRLAREPDAAWYEEAQAGLEDLPLRGADGKLPYVVKTPHLHQMLDEVLADGGRRIDAVIVPVRDLTEAAASRVVMERQHVHRSAPWMAELNETWEVWGETPGGIVYSLNPLDQARLLAVGFYRLVERLVRADVTLILLAFPRIVTDADYLFDRLRPVLPAAVDRAAARAAHARIADPRAVRVSRAPAGDTGPVLRHDDTRTLDAEAMRRELRRLRAALAAAEGRAAAAEAACAEVSATAAATWNAYTAARDGAEAARADLAALRQSTAWRLTSPYRRAGTVLKAWLFRGAGRRG